MYIGYTNEANKKELKKGGHCLKERIFVGKGGGKRVDYRIWSEGLNLITEKRRRLGFSVRRVSEPRFRGRSQTEKGGGKGPSPFWKCDYASRKTSFG